MIHRITYTIEHWAGNYGPRSTIYAKCSCGKDFGEISDPDETVVTHRNEEIDRILGQEFPNPKMVDFKEWQQNP
jgi:hypothetical protein